jgi:methanogenic corrinoid protein MtbC1
MMDLQLNPSLSRNAVEYINYVLNGQRQKASQLIMQTVENGMSVKDIYLSIFQPVQWEIGRLWQTNQVSVAQEHYCTAATQLIMSQLYPYIFNSEKIGRTFIATCVSGELHEIGVRMVADFFEMEGWDTYYVGANTPVESIIQSVEVYQADVLGISTTMLFHVKQVKNIIEQIKQIPSCSDVKILVGGYPFNVTENLWRKVSADGYGGNAMQAIQEASKLVVVN